jgi:NADPH:quinone reductase-like Zn-dependent oxidoreductase
MKACRIHRFGGPDVIEVEDIAPPEPGPGEARVRVEASGVGPWDAWIRSGKSVVPQPLPLTLGVDISGEIDRLGDGVTDLRVGELVFGATNERFTGANAEYAVASAAMLARKPERLSFAEAAAVPVVVVTAWQALFEKAKLARGDTVLIHGAAGSVGAFAVQLARWAQLTVLATAGPDDLAFVKGLGANNVIDYRTERFEDRARGVDAVIDLVGGDTQTRSCNVLMPGGALVSAVSRPDPAAAQSHGVRAEFFLVEVTTDRLTRIAGLLQRGALSVDVGATLPLASIRQAHEMLDGGRRKPRGKIVLTP